MELPGCEGRGEAEPGWSRTREAELGLTGCDQCCAQGASMDRANWSAATGASRWPVTAIPDASPIPPITTSRTQHAEVDGTYA